MATDALRVFISYSHESKEHSECVLALTDRLRGDGLDAWIDQYELAPPEGWPRWMETQVEQADVVLCVFTETYRRRYDQREPPGVGRGVTWEAGLLRMQLYLDQGKNEGIVPIVFEAGGARQIPLSLKAFDYYEPLSDAGYEKLYRRLTKQPNVTAPPLGSLKKLPSKPRQSLLLDGAKAETHAAETHAAETQVAETSLDIYRRWAQQRYDHLDLIGIDAGDVQVHLDEVYVPLRVVHHADRDVGGIAGLGMFRGMGRHGELGETKNIDVEDVLRESRSRHPLIFGEPGSGKTTALLKLHHLCIQGDPKLGLSKETIPVFLRLRHLSKDLLEQGLAACIEHEVQEISGGRVPLGIGDVLWRHQQLLLLCDGLDEIADAEHRAEVLRRIGWYLGDAKATSVRAVVTCRRVGLPKREADRDAQFQKFEVRPFQNEQIAQLVTQWFRELARRGRIGDAVAEERVTTILGALTDRTKSNQQLLQMASNPLLLTLLCVVVLLGNEIPKKRVRFYEQCLDIMLDRWPRQRKGHDPPVDLSTAREALGHLAFYLHHAERRDNLRWVEALQVLKMALGDRVLARRLLTWTHEHVGLIVDYTDTTFGFVHLGLQENLTAHHLMTHSSALDFIQKGFDESWWTEVFLQISALSERTSFDALMAQLLQHTDLLERRADLLGDCLREAQRPELSAFLEVLRQDSVPRQAAVLRVLRSTSHRPPELLEVLEHLATSGSSAMRPLAQSLLSKDEQRAHEVALFIACDEDRAQADRLRSRLRGWRGGRSVTMIEGADRRTEEQLEACGVVVILLGPSTEDWQEAAMLRSVYDDKPWLAVTLPGEPRPTVPEIFSDCQTFDWRRREEHAVLDWIVEQLHEALSEEYEEESAVRSLGSPMRGFVTRSRSVATRGCRSLSRSSIQ